MSCDFVNKNINVCHWVFILRKVVLSSEVKKRVQLFKYIKLKKTV